MSRARWVKPQVPPPTLRFNLVSGAASALTATAEHAKSDVARREGWPASRVAGATKSESLVEHARVAFRYTITGDLFAGIDLVAEPVTFSGSRSSCSTPHPPNFSL